MQDALGWFFRIQAVLFHPVNQRAARDAQIARRLRLVAVVHIQGVADDFAFHFVERDALGGQLEFDVAEYLQRLRTIIRHVR